MKRILLTIIILNFSSFAQDQNGESVIPPINLIVLLDLSDRIDDKEQFTRDIEVVKIILNAFEHRQQFDFMFLTSSDRMQITGAGQRSQSLSNFQDSLILDMAAGKFGGRTPRPEFTKKKETLVRSLENLYGSISKVTKTGADIWGWMKQTLPLLIDNSPDRINKLIIITDGYLQFDSDLVGGRQSNTYMKTADLQKLRNKSNWKEIFDNNKFGLESANQYNNLEVLLLEFDPKDPFTVTNEYDIIKYYWSTWLQEMGAQDPQTIRNDFSFTVLTKKIKTFISTN